MENAERQQNEGRRENLPPEHKDLNLTIGETVNVILSEGKRDQLFFLGQFPPEGQPIRNEQGQRLLKFTDGKDEYLIFEDPQRISPIESTITESIAQKKPAESLDGDAGKTNKFYPPEKIRELVESLGGTKIDLEFFEELRKHWKVEGVTQDASGELVVILKSEKTIPLAQFIKYVKEVSE
ncbi:MAG: hypothetical protein AAB479_03140 [Patescibacteria group bacterium]